MDELWEKISEQYRREDDDDVNHDDDIDADDDDEKSTKNLWSSRRIGTRLFGEDDDRLNDEDSKSLEKTMKTEANEKRKRRSLLGNHIAASLSLGNSNSSTISQRKSAPSFGGVKSFNELSHDKLTKSVESTTFAWNSENNCEVILTTNSKAIAASEDENVKNLGRAIETQLDVCLEEPWQEIVETALTGNFDYDEGNDRHNLSPRRRQLDLSASSFTDESSCVDSALADVRAAFDTVRHRIDERAALLEPGTGWTFRDAGEAERRATALRGHVVGLSMDRVAAQAAEVRLWRWVEAARGWRGENSGCGGDEEVVGWRKRVNRLSLYAESIVELRREFEERIRRLDIVVAWWREMGELTSELRLEMATVVALTSGGGGNGELLQRRDSILRCRRLTSNVSLLLHNVKDFMEAGLRRGMEEEVEGLKEELGRLEEGIEKGERVEVNGGEKVKEDEKRVGEWSAVEGKEKVSNLEKREEQEVVEKEKAKTTTSMKTTSKTYSSTTTNSVPFQNPKIRSTMDVADGKGYTESDGDSMGSSTRSVALAVSSSSGVWKTGAWKTGAPFVNESATQNLSRRWRRSGEKANEKRTKDFDRRSKEKKKGKEKSRKISLEEENRKKGNERRLSDEVEEDGKKNGLRIEREFDENKNNCFLDRIHRQEKEKLLGKKEKEKRRIGASFGWTFDGNVNKGNLRLSSIHAQKTNQFSDEFGKKNLYNNNYYDESDDKDSFSNNFKGKQRSKMTTTTTTTSTTKSALYEIFSIFLIVCVSLLCLYCLLPKHFFSNLTPQLRYVDGPPPH